VITLNDGRELRRREAINRGAAEGPIVREDVIVKFRDNAQMALPPARAQALLEHLLAVDALSARALESILAG
jgi:hypothetical protein